MQKRLIFCKRYTEDGLITTMEHYDRYMKENVSLIIYILGIHKKNGINFLELKFIKLVNTFKYHIYRKEAPTMSYINYYVFS